jgi:hypothetical protein
MRAAAAALAALVGLGQQAAARAATEPAALNLLQLTARAELVVHVRVHEGALKHALVDVLETLKGSAPAARLRIAFRDLNLRRRPGTPPLVFPDGQEEILFLRPYPARGRREEKNRDLFELAGGAQGRMTVPGEGAPAVLDTVRSLVAIARSEPVEQVRALRGHLSSPNHLLVEAVLQEMERLRAAGPGHYRDLVRLLQSPRASLKRAALRLLTQIFPSPASDTGPYVAAETEAGAPDPEEEARVALASVIERARNDPDESVRAAAVVAMGAWTDPADTDPDLRAIAASDPAQGVRYEAEKILFARDPGRSLK